MRLLVLSGLLVTCAACTSIDGQRMSASEYARAPAPQPDPTKPGRPRVDPAGPPGRLLVPASAAGSSLPSAAGVPGAAGASSAAASADELLGEKNALDKRVIDLGRRREDLARNLSELEQKRQRTQLEHQSAEADEALALERAQLEHRNATQDLEHFLADEKPLRLAEDALGIQASWDGLLETREEMVQLEMMYGDADLGDATAEIQLNRTRRRLQRAEESHRLREIRSEDLKVVTLPREEERLRLELKARTVALEGSQRAMERGRLSRAESLRALDVEARSLGREAEDIDRDDTLLDADRVKHDKKLAAQKTSRESPK
jgi:hypothetical protein